MARVSVVEIERENIALSNSTESDICILLARRIRRLRIASKETQSDFAERARIPLRTYKRFELTGQASLENFIQMLIALNCTQYLKHLLPVPASAIESESSLLIDPAKILALARDPSKAIKTVMEESYKED